MIAARLPSRRLELLKWAVGAQLRIAQQALDAGWRAYPPLVFAAAATSPRLRRAITIGLTASVAADWLQRRPRLDPLRFGALRAADHLAYAIGVWRGCARERTLVPLVPGLVPTPRVMFERVVGSSVAVDGVLGLPRGLVDRVLHR